MKFIECENVSFSYSNNKTSDKKNAESERNVLAVDRIDFDAIEGEFIAVLGHNGSGKSTFAKLINGIFRPSEGKVTVDGLISDDDKNIWEIRTNVGMVFQNPDNQIVATIVEEDVAFGAENIGIESGEIIERVKKSLAAVDMSEYSKTAPHLLSGGQKQRIAIAGVLAMKPKCIILDEATAMLDPIGRKKIIDIIMRLNKEEKITVILITHFMEEALLADKVFIMESGKIVMSGTPREIFSEAEKIKRLGLDLPAAAAIGYNLRKYGIDIDRNIIYEDEFVNYVIKNIKLTSKNKVASRSEKRRVFNDKIIEVKNVSYIYNESSAFEKKAIKNVTIDIFKGEIVALIGKTGSGKSTLAQTLNGLIKPTDGEIFVNGKNIWEKGFKIKEVRKKVGIVFQYPEYQLFEETVFKDAMFGPLNMGFSEEEATLRVIKAFKAVGISPELFEKSPFELSGGQKRRVAIAGVIAMEPEVLILDEPTAGLDPKGRDEILKNVKNARSGFDMTVIMVSHSMEEVCGISDRVIVMNNGEAVLSGGCGEVFQKGEILRNSGISPPAVNVILKKIIDRGVIIPHNIYTVADAVDFFKERL